MNITYLKGERCFLSRERCRKVKGKQVKDLHDLVTVTVQHYPCAVWCSHCYSGKAEKCAIVRKSGDLPFIGTRLTAAITRH